MAVGALAGAANAYSSAYGAVDRFMGFRDPAYALKYKGPQQAARWARKEERYGAYPELSRTTGRVGLGLLMDRPEDFYKKFPGLELYDDQAERFMANPLEDQATASRDASQAGAARYAGRYNLGPEYMTLAGQRTSEDERSRIAAARRSAYMTRLLGNRENAMRSVGLSEDLFSSRQRQFAENEWNQASGMASYAQAVNSQQQLEAATGAANQNAWMGGIGSIISATGAFRPAGLGN